MSAVIEASRLTKWYGPVIAVNDVTVDVQPGITALLGPNGAGKSTLLGLFTGQLAPTRGELLVLGEPVWCNSRLNLRLGLCHQHDNFYEDMTGLQFVTLMAKLSGIDLRDSKARARALLQRVGLEEKAWGRKLRTYSKGMRQRTKLAQALIHEPEMLFLDEPMTGLDPVGRHEISELVRDLARVGKSVLVSTHILHEVETLTDQILLLARGKVIAEGDVHHIRESLETHPYSIEVVCDRPRAIADIFIGRDFVSAVEINEDALRPHVVIRTHRADLVFGELPRVVLEEGLRIEEISSPDDTLEAVFEYLVG